MAEKDSESGWAAVLVPSLIAALIGGIAGFYGSGLSSNSSSPAESLGQSNTVVLDVSQWIERNQGVTDEGRSNSVADQVREVALELRARGYIVLYPEAVIEAPSALKIGPNEAESLIN